MSAVKLIASIITSVMSFLGWSTADYGEYLPGNIRAEIIFGAPKDIAPEENRPALDVPRASRVPETSPIIPPRPKLEEKPTAKPEPPKKIEAPQAPPAVGEAALSAPLSPQDSISRSVVNILCSMQRGGLIQKFTGSGVVIDSRGVLLTNAHVAEHIMLEEAGFESCSVRIGSPAQSSYKAKVLYLPDIWIANNANNLKLSTLTGTGENDYALLVLTERTSAGAPDIPLPHIPLGTSDAKIGDGITLAGYPASFGDVSLLDNALYFLEKPSSIIKVSGFDGFSSDVVNTSPTPLAEHGSSGGAIVADDGSLLGIMVAVTTDSYTGSKNIQGITVPYIMKSIQKNAGKSYQALLENAQEEIENFEKIKAPSLSAILMQGM